uniref:Uncharacterized protein n=1 Tax=Arundo donax TaxID=35708 RepID=A0A0A9CK44_ARUDO
MMILLSMNKLIYHASMDNKFICLKNLHMLFLPVHVH